VQRFDLVLDWVASAQFAGPCLALVQGLYETEGVDLRLVPWEEDGRSIIEKTLDRAVPAAGSAEDNLVVAARAGGTGILALAAMFQTTPLVVMSLPGSGIAELADLRGKRVAMHCDGIKILRALLAQAGIGEDEVEIAEVTHDLGNLVSGRWDAVQGYAVSEPLELAARGVAVTTLTLRGPSLHPYAQVVFAAEEPVTRAPSLYRAVLDATFAGWRAAIAEPEAAARAVRAVGAPMASADLEREALTRVLSLVQGEGWGLGKIDPGRRASNVASYVRADIVPPDTPPHAALGLDVWVDDAFLDESAARPNALS